ncbi:MAG: AraC family transcriptional regulator [Ferruginibacter sp.]
MNSYRFTQENNIKAFAKSNLSFKDSSINYSNLLSLDGSFTSKCVGIKYVTAGTEKYIVNGKTHHVSSKQFLVLNKGQKFECTLKSSIPVLGACISLGVDLVRQANDYLMRSTDDLLSTPIMSNQPEPEFHECVYSQHDKFSTYIAAVIKQDQYSDPGESAEFYQELAVELLLSQKEIFSQIHKIKALKDSTRKELYNRLYQAKMIIDSTDAEKINIPGLAIACAVSEFHFYRSFKIAFGVSPYKYVVSRRLDKAKLLLTSNTKKSITDIAYEAGFTDIYSFSRSFKKHFRHSPSELLNVI